MSFLPRFAFEILPNTENSLLDAVSQCRLLLKRLALDVRSEMTGALLYDRDKDSSCAHESHHITGCCLTVDARSRLTVSSERSMLGRARCWVEAWWALGHVTGSALLRHVLRWWGETRATLTSSTCHNALEQICGAMADSWWRWLRRSAMG